MSTLARASAPPTDIAVGSIDDPLGRDADHVARQVMSPAPRTAVTGARCGCGRALGAGSECAHCRAARLSRSLDPRDIIVAGHP